MDSSGIVKMALGVGAGYLVYKYMSEPAAAPVGPLPAVPGGGGGNSAPPAVPSATSTPPPTVTTPPPVTQFNSLDAIGQRVLSAVGSQSLTPDQFNFYLASQLAAGTTPPDPVAVFTQAGWDRNATMTFPQWWGVMAPYLRTNLGLSGFGVLHGCGAYVARRAGR